MRALLGILLFYGRFLPSFTVLGYLSRRWRWSDELPSLENRHVVVTGASGGIGAAVCRGADAAGATTRMVARSEEKLSDLAGELSERAIVSVHDLSRQDDIRALVDEIGQDGRPVDVLVNNVGVMLNAFVTTDDGVDKQFATNLLNHFLLVEALHERGLLARDAVVISVASGGMYMAPLVLSVLNSHDEAAFDGTREYAVQKRAQVVLTHYWQNDESKQGLRFYVMHPGWVDTAGVQTSLPTFRRLLGPLLRSPEQGADTILWLARKRPDNPDRESIWFDRRARKTHVYGFTRDRSAAAEELVGFLRRHIRR